MTGCKYVDGEYLNDGEPCRTDDYGDPTRHCTARRSCAQHVGPGEHTCARCVGRTRVDIRTIVARSCELLPAAMHGGNVNTETANLAGPAADVEAWMWRKIAARQGGSWHVSLIEDDDELHPYSVLCRWAMMIAEDYHHDLATLDIARAAAYLERQLPRIAQDPEQDFPLFARELRKCRQHLEAVLQDSTAPERGAPCPMCDAPAPRLHLERGHYCDDPTCEQQFHYTTALDKDTGEMIADTSGDRWVCPRDRDHAWVEADYRRWVADVYEANRGVG
jgi:hypothetical protein